jgi:hypothetical protein
VGDLNPVRKARRAGALYEGRKPADGQRNPEVRCQVRREAFRAEGREGNLRWGEDTSGGFIGGEPERFENPREQETPTGVKTREAKRGTAFQVG